MADENIALVEAALDGRELPATDDDLFDPDDDDAFAADPVAEQAAQQSDAEKPGRQRDPEY